MVFNLGSPCGGDGGAPYAAPGSQASGFCTSAFHGAVTWAPIVAYLLALGLLRWRGWGRWRAWWLLVAPVAAVAAGVAAAGYLTAHMT